MQFCGKFHHISLSARPVKQTCSVTFAVFARTKVLKLATRFYFLCLLPRRKASAYQKGTKSPGNEFDLLFKNVLFNERPFYRTTFVGGLSFRLNKGTFILIRTISLNETIGRLA